MNLAKKGYRQHDRPHKERIKKGNFDGVKARVNKDKVTRAKVANPLIFSISTRVVGIFKKINQGLRSR